MAARRFIFLDCDGVVSRYRQSQFDPHPPLFERSKMQLIREIVKATGAQIVLSSDWRLKPENKDRVTWELVQNDCPEPIGYTPWFSTDGTCRRPLEILTWLKNAFRTTGMISASFVILDDIHLERYCDTIRQRVMIEAHHVWTPPTIGITSELALRAIDVLTDRTLVVTKNDVARAVELPISADGATTRQRKQQGWSPADDVLREIAEFRVLLEDLYASETHRSRPARKRVREQVREVAASS